MKLSSTTSTIAIVVGATSIGLSQGFLYKEIPALPVALWFPWGVFAYIATGSKLIAIFTALIQFMVLAAILKLLCHWVHPYVASALTAFAFIASEYMAMRLMVRF